MMVHRNYLNQVFNRCFLHPKNAVIHGCLLKILNTALIFQKMWDSGLETTTYVFLKKKTQRIYLFYVFLLNCMKYPSFV